MKRNILVIALMMYALVKTAGQNKAPDLVIINAKVFTVDKSSPYTEAIAVSGEYITATGTTAEISKLIDPDKTRIINAGGRLVIPGFNDAHVHFGPLNPDYVELRYINDPALITRRVKEKAEASGPGTVIRGGHWEHEMFNDRQWPTKELIDRVSPRNPVILTRADGHSVLVNSLVLKSSGIDRNTPDPAGGEIVRDPNTGEPTGILKENAMSLIRIKEEKQDMSTEERKKREHTGYLLALQEAREYGVTSVQIPGEADFDAYDRLMHDGLLSCRVDIGEVLTGEDSKLEKYRQLSEKYPRSGNWIRFGYLKAFIDGTIGSGTALMFEPFDDNKESSGLSMMPYSTFEAMVVKADSKGFQIGVHSIGDKGNNWTLNAYEKALAVNGMHDSRHRDEHAQTLLLSDIPRFARLGVIASMQPTHCISDKKFCEKRIGHERARGAYAWNSLAKSGASLAFGTDYQVEPLNPMEGLYAAVSRKERRGEPGEGWFPDEKISMAKAIEFYTLGAAYAQFMEDRKGIIKTGYLADLVITDRDLLSIDEPDIMKTKIDYTIVGGKIVFMREK